MYGDVGNIQWQCFFFLLVGRTLKPALSVSVGLSCKACERASETRERALHGQEQNNAHGKHERVTRQSSQHTSTITCTAVPRVWHFSVFHWYSIEASWIFLVSVLVCLANSTMDTFVLFIFGDVANIQRQWLFLLVGRTLKCIEDFWCQCWFVVQTQQWTLFFTIDVEYLGLNSTLKTWNFSVFFFVVFF